MKNLFAALIALVAINANAMNPVQQAKVDDHFDSLVPTVEVALACRDERRYEYLEEVMYTGYLLADALEQVWRDVVDMKYSAAKMRMPNNYKQLIRFIKINPEHATSVESCTRVKSVISKILD